MHKPLRSTRAFRGLAAASVLAVIMGEVPAARAQTSTAGDRDSNAPIRRPATDAERTQSTLDQARLFLDADMPVSAASLLARELSRGGIEGDEAALLAAEAFVAQRSWEPARRLLTDHDFSTADDRRRAALLLARAYSGLGSAASAIELYEQVLSGTPGDPPVGMRTDLAAALGREARWGEAARQLDLAASESPGVEAWIRLSRLYVLAEAGDSAAFSLADSLVRERRVPGDSALLAAARLAFETGRPALGTATARRAGQGVWRELAARHIGPYLLANGDSSGAAGAFRAALEAGRPGEEEGPALLALDRSWRALRDVGRSDRRAGRNERAARYLEAALEIAPEAEKPEIVELLVGAHVALGDPNRAAQILSPWIGGREASASDRATLWLLAARTFTSLGEPLAADEAYENAAEGTGSSAALAAYLIADALHDADRPEEATAAFGRAYQRFPASSYGSRSLERLALLAFHTGEYDETKRHLDEYRRRYPRGGWVQGAIYWTGKTEEARGDTAAARAFYLEAVRHDPLGYYAILASRHLDRDRWAMLRLREDEPDPPLDAAYANALERMNRLRDLGWVGRARREYRAAARRGPSAVAQVLAFAHALNRAGWTQEGIREGWRAKSQRQRWSRSMLRAIYPLPFLEALRTAAEDRDLPAPFVAGLSRRESMFDPEVVSLANAVGLMQLLPQTARDVSSRAGLPEYRRSQLTVPQVNLLLGTQYLADVLDRFDGSRVAGMISYNAGPHRYNAWRGFPEFRDPEQLVERIPFRETREYVRAVTELTEIYRFLYPDLDAPLP